MKKKRKTNKKGVANSFLAYRILKYQSISLFIHMGKTAEFTIRLEPTLYW
jgi:hypothetical protein